MWRSRSAAAAVASDLAPLDGDPRALEQVLVNLVDNAVKYCPAGTTVTLAAANDGDDALRIGVEDTGPGIDAKHLPRVFERFYRVDKGRSRDVGGTGLGLYISRELVLRMNGRIWVDSDGRTGSSFFLELPVA